MEVCSSLSLLIHLSAHPLWQSVSCQVKIITRAYKGKQLESPAAAVAARVINWFCGLTVGTDLLQRKIKEPKTGNTHRKMYTSFFSSTSFPENFISYKTSNQFSTGYWPTIIFDFCWKSVNLCAEWVLIFSSNSQQEIQQVYFPKCWPIPIKSGVGGFPIQFKAVEGPWHTVGSLVSICLGPISERLLWLAVERITAREEKKKWLKQANNVVRRVHTEGSFHFSPSSHLNIPVREYIHNDMAIWNRSENKRKQSVVIKIGVKVVPNAALFTICNCWPRSSSYPLLNDECKLPPPAGLVSYCSSHRRRTEVLAVDLWCVQGPLFMPKSTWSEVKQ